MGIKQFFRKTDDSIKKAFSKGGAVESGLKKFGDKIVQSGPAILNTLGKIGEAIAPAISMVAPEIGIPLLAGSTAVQGGVSNLRSGHNIVKQFGL